MSSGRLGIDLSSASWSKWYKPLRKVIIWTPTSSLQSNWWGLCYWLSGVRLLSKSSVPAASSGCLPLLQTAKLLLITVGVLNVDWRQNAIQNLQAQGRRDIWFMNGIFSNLCIYGSFFPGEKKKIKKSNADNQQKFVFSQFRRKKKSECYIHPFLSIYLMTVSGLY